MVHHTEWDRKKNQQGGYMQKDHDEMEDIIREMSPGGKHYHAFKDGSIRTDAQIVHSGASSEVVHKGKPYNPSLPSFYHGRWYQSSYPFLMSMFSIMFFILILSCIIHFFRMARRSITRKRSSRSKSRSR